jgi:hypothetical protein
MPGMLFLAVCTVKNVIGEGAENSKPENAFENIGSIPT